MSGEGQTLDPNEAQKYPPHVLEPVRREIAQMLITKEFLKLLPSVDDDNRRRMNEDIEGWFVGNQYELAPIHDFWNAAEAILDIKLKHIVRFLTAENISWQQKEIDINTLSLQTNLPALEADVGKAPLSIARLREAFDSPAVRQRQLVDDQAHSQPPRDNYPIIVLQRGDDVSLLDGNRRLRKAVLYDKPTLTAYVGTFDGEPFAPQNYWVATTTIRNLLFLLSEASADAKPALESAVREVLNQWFAVSSIARTNFRRATSTKLNHYQHFLEEYQNEAGEDD